MSYSQPEGYRFPGADRLTSIGSAMDRFGWRVWHRETIRALATVVVEVMTAEESRDAVFRRLSHDQVRDDELTFSRHHHGCLLVRVAEFLDVAHAAMLKPTALPLPPALDLRCRSQFMEDPADPEYTWTYLLFGTERAVLEELILHMPGIEHYPVPPVGAGFGSGADPEAAEREEVWQRVLAPYSRISPLSISAPEPGLMFDISESLLAGGRDAELAAQGKATVSAVVAEVAGRLGDREAEELEVVLRTRLSD